MRSSGLSYFVNAFCLIGIMFVIHGGFVPILGLSPFIWLAFFIIYPAFFYVDQHYSDRNRRLHESRKHMLREFDEQSRKYRAAIQNPEEGQRKILPTMVIESGAATSCVLTDQIFEAARRKGINPEDVIGPRRGDEDFV